MAINVKVNMPDPKLMDEFQDRLCNCVAKAIVDTKSRKYIEELKIKLSESEKISLKTVI